MRRLIRANGTTQDFDAPLTIRQIESLIGAECLDSVMLADRVHVMCVDDHFAEKELALNREATLLYYDAKGGPVDWAICGDVVIVPYADFETHARKLRRTEIP